MLNLSGKKERFLEISLQKTFCSGIKIVMFQSQDNFGDLDVHNTDYAKTQLTSTWRSATRPSDTVNWFAP